MSSDWDLPLVNELGIEVPRGDAVDAENMAKLSSEP
jgi:hypothetical protein